MKKKPFTLLELLTAMTVFTIFMLAVMRFFGLSQDVMSSSTNNVGQYEKVRVVMDMLASDLQNIYYNEGVDTFVYYQENDSSKNVKTLDIPVQRNQKIGKSDVALARVHYELVDDIVINEGGVDGTGKISLKKLQILAIGNKDKDGNQEPGWVLHRYRFDDKGVDFIFPALSGHTMTTILDGVVDMKIRPYNHNAVVTSDGVPVNTYSVNTAGNARIPDYLIVEIRMVDDNILKTVRERKAMGIAVEIKDEDCRLFSRRIDIDRGQSF